VLDGIDKLKEQEYLLYTLSSINNTGLVCICTDEHLFRNLDERVQSRLMPARIHFLPYAPDQLMTILKERAEQALNDSTWDLETLRTIAERAGGNARIAIQTLRRVAEFAEATGAGHIRQALKAATPDLRTGNRASILAKLGTHHQFLYEIIRANPEIRSGKLWHLYNRRCASQTIAPVARRTFTEYLRELESLRLLRSEWISVDGRTRRFWVAVG
jgi:Cdc6-like AAA superfamily ATPase